MFFAVVRFSPPSQETEAAKRKAKAKNNSPDPQEPIFNLLVAAKGRSPRPRHVNLRLKEKLCLRHMYTKETSAFRHINITIERLNFNVRLKNECSTCI